jgi:hypothetical protein
LATSPAPCNSSCQVSLDHLKALTRLGAVAVALWHASVLWSGKGTWSTKVWSVVLSLATLTLLYVAVVFKLIGFDVTY